MFDENNVYLQWLEWRGPGPVWHNRYTMHIIWGMTFVNIVLYLTYGSIERGLAYSPILSLILIIAVLCLSFLLLVTFPVLFIIIDLLLNPSKAMDLNRNILQGLFVSPIPTSTIIGALRKWALRKNLVHLAPSVLMGVVMLITILVTGGNGHGSIPVFVLQTANILFIGLLIWLLLYSVGIAFASMYPWFRISAFFILAGWFIFAYVVIYSSWSQDLRDLVIYDLSQGLAERNFPTPLKEEICNGFIRIFNVFPVIVPAIAFWFLQVPLMNLRRRHLWK